MSVNPRIPENKFRASQYVSKNYTDTHSFFAENNKEFRTLCELAKIDPTKLQARKFSQKRGKAWQMKTQLASASDATGA